MCKAPKEDEFRGAESTGAGKGMMAGANLFGLINAVLTCVVLGIVATRGGDVKKTTNNAADAHLDTPEWMKQAFLNTMEVNYGENPCIDASGQAPLRADLGDIECENAGAQSATDVTDYSTGAKGTANPGLAPIVDYNDMGMCTVNVHWHIGAEHKSVGQYDETAELDSWTDPHPNKDTYAGSHRRLASADGSMQIGHMCNVGKQLWDEADPSVQKSDGSVNEYDWKYCKDMHVGLTYEFHWPHSSLGACQTPWQYQYHFLDGVLCGATIGNVDIATASALLMDKTHGIGVEGQVFTIVNGGDDAAKRPTWDVLNGWDRQAAKDVAYYQGSTTGDAVQSGANAGDMCRGTGDLVTWHVDRECHTLEASTMDEMCRRMLVISADDMSPDIAPHGARETVIAALTDPAEDHPDYPGTRRLRGSN